ncbi:MAG: histone deacetylase [Candidatus Bathyarchaeia archaeon]
MLNSKVLVMYHEKFKQYDLGEGHPLRGDRYVNAMNFFREHGLLNLDDVTVREPPLATIEDLLMVHDKRYVDTIFRLAERGIAYDVETPISPGILEAALLFVGGSIECGKAVMKGDVEKAISIGGGFHHAGKDYGGGFCIFNDIAVAAEWVKVKMNVKRVLILDYDAHFGNGTSDIFYRDPSVLFISIHQDPFTIYPGRGFTWEIGEGPGKGFNVNIPLPPGTGDNTYLYALSEIFVPLAEEFKPEIIFANGGSDPHFADRLGSLGLTVNGFFKLARLIRNTADRVCGGKLVLMMGSGYNPDVLPMCWYALASGLVGLENIDIKEPYAPPIEPSYCIRKVEETINELKGLLKEKWSCFK